MKKIIAFLFVFISLISFSEIRKSSNAAFSIVNNAQDSIKPTAKDYIQDGLIAMWDGVENVAWEQHSDQLEQWNDLINGMALRASDGYVGNFLSGYLHQGVAFYNGMGDPETKQGMRYYTKWIAIRKILNSGLFTVEFVCAAYTAGISSWNYNNNTHLGFGLVSSHSSLSFIMNGNIQFHNGILNSGNKLACLPFQGDGIRTSRSIAFDKISYTIYAYANGSLYSIGELSQTVNWSGSDNGPLAYLNTCIGNACGNASNTWANPQTSITDIFCIRIYSRKLSNEEISYNYQIDKKRFRL